MASPVLLVADDLSTIAAVKRVLSREGYEVILATSAADAVIAWGHHLPGLVLLQPSVEGERGAVLLEELQQHPDARLLRVVILGETVPGFPYPIEPLPIDPEHFAQTLAESMRASTTSHDTWSVIEAPKMSAPPQPTPEGDEWRATAPTQHAPTDATLPEADLPPMEVAPGAALSAPTWSPQTTEEAFAPTPDPSRPADEGDAAQREGASVHADPDATAPVPPSHSSGEWASQNTEAGFAEAPEPVATAPVGPRASLEDKLFGDLPAIEASIHRDVEAEVMANVESSIAAAQDDELQRLEDEVRAEAQRRRASRDSGIRPRGAASTLTGEQEDDGDDETSFASASGSTDETHAEKTPPPDDDGPRRTAPAQAREVLARAEAMMLESRAVADANRRVEEAQGRQTASELDAVKRRADHAEDLLQAERAARANLEEDLRVLHAHLDAERTQFREQAEAAEAHRVTFERDLSEQLEAERQMVDSLQRALDERDAAYNEAQAQLDVARELNAQQQAEREALQQRLDGEVHANEQLNAQVTEISNELARVSEDLTAQTTRREEVERELTELRSVKAELTALSEKHQQVEAERDQLDHQVTDLTARLDAAHAQAEQLPAAQEALTHSKSRADELAEHVVSLESSLKQLRSSGHETANERDVLKGDVERLSTELGEATAQVARLTKDVATLREALDAAAARADTAEAGVQLASERIKDLEHRAVMPITLPGRRPLGVARTGAVDLEGLARLVGQLVLGQADARLELGVPGGLRTLWFKKGLVVAAESTLAHETLIDRARRDGLIDARQEAELRLLKHANAREQLEALKARSLLRDIESVPLAQRYTEQLALEAFGEEQTQYRLADDVPTSQVLQAAVPRATLPMLAEAIRRSLPVDALLEKLHGAEARVEPRETELDARSLGFAERERKMLSWVDGETTVQDLALASGLKQDVAFRALLVAKLLGLVEVVAPKEQAAVVSPDLEVQRLDAKYDEVLEADYFTILGLPKTAGTDDVQRAFNRLSSEFDPLKFSGHPDPALQQRAQVVFTHLEEAAKALEDERRRADYARHLLD